MPFSFEGKRRLKQAEESLEQIQKRTDGSLLPVNDLILKRILPLYGIQLIGTLTTPIISGLAVLVDCLCIFRKDRNTIHDDIAGSKVVVLPQQ